MIEAKMPKDIRVYETKLIGPLTLRQMLQLSDMMRCMILMIRNISPTEKQKTRR